MAWDKTKPATNGNLVSADHRANWEAIEGAVGVNLIADPTFLIWPAGDSSAPAHYTLSGTAPVIARAGSGLADTTRKVGSFCAKVTGGSTTATLAQQILTTSSYNDFLDGLTVTFGCWVWCASASSARITISDGATSTNSNYHTGGSSWEWLSVTHVIDASATQLVAQMTTVASIVSYFSGPTFLISDIPTTKYVPSPVVYGSVVFSFAGSASAAGGPNSNGTDVEHFVFQRPALIKDVQLSCASGFGPTGAAIIVDVNKSTTSMFSTTKVQIAAGSTYGSLQPDSSTYSTRCFTGASGSSATNALLSIDIDQVGSTLPGSWLKVSIRCLQFARPLEAFLLHSEVN